MYLDCAGKVGGQHRIDDMTPLMDLTAEAPHFPLRWQTTRRRSTADIPTIPSDGAVIGAGWWDIRQQELAAEFFQDRIDNPRGRRGGRSRDSFGVSVDGQTLFTFRANTEWRFLGSLRVEPKLVLKVVSDRS